MQFEKDKYYKYIKSDIGIYFRITSNLMQEPSEKYREKYYKFKVIHCSYQGYRAGFQGYRAGFTYKLYKTSIMDKYSKPTTLDKIRVEMI